MENTDVIRQLVERWNAGDLDGVLELYAEDAVMVSGPDWPEQAERHGREGIRANIAEWLGVWDWSRLEIASIETFGDKLVGDGTWSTRGRSSGVAGEMPFVALMTLRDGRIERFEWFTDHDAAVAAARGT